jgi:hypothetical protein
MGDVGIVCEIRGRRQRTKRALASGRHLFFRGLCPGTLPRGAWSVGTVEEGGGIQLSGNGTLFPKCQGATSPTYGDGSGEADPVAYPRRPTTCHSTTRGGPLPRSPSPPIHRKPNMHLITAHTLRLRPVASF